MLISSMFIKKDSKNDIDNSAKEVSITELPIDNIKPNPYRQRKQIEAFSINELAQSIKQHGVIQPICVRGVNGGYEVVAGTRRLRAAKIAGLENIPVRVITADEKTSSILAFIENIQRKNLTYFEEAEGYAEIMNDHDVDIDDIATEVGKSRAFVASKLRLLNLSEDVRKKIISNGLTEDFAKLLVKIPDEEIVLDTLEEIISKSLNIAKSEILVENVLNKMSGDDSGRKIRRCMNDIRLISNTIKETVNIIRGAGIRADYVIDENEYSYEIKITVPIKDNVSGIVV